MNTVVSVWLWSASALAAMRLREAESLFGQAEAELSRFRPDSGLSRLNARAGGGPQAASPLLYTVLGAALNAASSSGGLFDPTVLRSLEQAGYDRSFELLGQDQAGSAPGEWGRAQPLGWQAVHLDAISGAVDLPAGMGVDLGGVAKGCTVDRAACHLAPWGAALVDAGGDMRATAPPDGEPWPIAVQDPFDPARDLMVLGWDPPLTTRACVRALPGRDRP